MPPGELRAKRDVDGDPLPMAGEDGEGVFKLFREELGRDDGLFDAELSGLFEVGEELT